MLDIKITSIAIEWVQDDTGPMCCITATVEVWFKNKCRVHDTFQVTSWHWNDNPGRLETEDRMLVWLADFIDRAGARGSMVWEYLEREAPPVLPFYKEPPPIQVRRFVPDDGEPIHA